MDLVLVHPVEDPQASCTRHSTACNTRDRVLFRLLAFERGTRPAGARRVEAALGDRREAFSSTITSADDPAAVLSALRAEIGLYLELSAPLLAEHGVSPNDGARTIVHQALDEGLGWTPSAAP